MRELPAEVINTDDPDKIGLVQVKIQGLFDNVPDIDQPWATYRLPVGAGAGRGDFTPCQKGDLVWVDFPWWSHGEPDTRKPRITGSVHYAPGGTLNAPTESLGKGYEHSESPDKAAYNESKTVTHHNATIEFMKSGALRVFSRESGSLIEISPNGKVLVFGAGDIAIQSKGSIGMSASGDIRINAGGNVDIDASKIFLN